MLVRRRMTPEVVTVPPTASVADALDTLNAHDIRHLPVVDAGRLVGIVTDRDLRLALTGRPNETLVTDVMTPDPVTVSPTATVEATARTMVERALGCVPVVQDGELVGILTDSDLLRAFVEIFARRAPHTRIELLAPDRPGELARVVRLIGVDHEINLTSVMVAPPTGQRSLVVLHAETKDVGPVLADLRRLGYEAASPSLLRESD